MPESSPKSRILIADENFADSELLKQYLGDLGSEFAVAPDGVQTLAQVAIFQPNLILIDLGKSQLGSIEIVRRLKSDPATRSISILLLSAFLEIRDIEAAVVAGIDDFVSKPVNQVELVKRVKNLLLLYHARP